MSEELCWKCKEALADLDISLRGSMLDVRPYLHCHHEPKEKPECWCESGHTIDSMGNGIAKTSIHGELIERNFCIRCGRKL